MYFNWKFAGLLFNVLWVKSLCSDLYSDNVKKYDTSEFRRNVGKESAHFINFFAPWCGYCKRLKPVWDELAEKYNTAASESKIIVAKVDCTVETPLCAEEGVSGYPSLIFYNPQSTDGVKYKGKRELSALEEFITVNINGIPSEDEIAPPVPKQSPTEGATELTDDNFHPTIDWGAHFVKFYAPWCGHCQTLAPIWDELAKTLEQDKAVTISKIDCTVNRQSCSEFQVKAFPTLLWIRDGKMIEKFQGERSLAELKRFVDTMKKEPADVTDNEDGKIPDQPVPPVELVVELTADNFDNAVSQGVTFVKFFAPWCGHCRRLAPTWEDLAHKFLTNAYVRIAKVDCTVYNELCNEFKVQGYPTLMIFRKGEQISEYRGVRDLESLHKFVLDTIPHDEL